jgi:ABC-type long-subunit fatty acid transport system fused permease/ATPase subunit
MHPLINLRIFLYFFVLYIFVVTLFKKNDEVKNRSRTKRWSETRQGPVSIFQQFNFPLVVTFFLGPKSEVMLKKINPVQTMGGLPPDPFPVF